MFLCRRDFGKTARMLSNRVRPSEHKRLERPLAVRARDHNIRQHSQASLQASLSAWATKLFGPHNPVELS